LVIIEVMKLTCNLLSRNIPLYSADCSSQQNNIFNLLAGAIRIRTILHPIVNHTTT
jgi:hypothetical protein